MMISWTYAELAGVTALCVIVLTAALWQLATRLAVAGRPSKTLLAAVPLAIMAWLLIAALLAHSGFLAMWNARPPHFLVIPLVAFSTLAFLSRTPLLRALLSVAPAHWPVAMQTFRIGVELAFWGLFAAGGAPVQVTFEGRNFDVLVGLTAPLVAFAIWKAWLRPQAVIAWNVLGLGVLLNTIFTTISSMPGPAHLDWPGMPFTAFASWPFVWIPAFLAPLAIFLHMASTLQQLAARKADAHAAHASRA